MVFVIMRIKQVRRNSPGEQAGLRPGDQIIAIDGRVFPTVAAFASYIGSKAPGSQGFIDYMPAGSGPAQAQRVGVTFGGSGWSGQPSAPPSVPSPGQAETGMSTGTKLAIGAGAAALLCYKMGCFSHRNPPSP
jgi:membrane-associated protease RseP (regulator of RpoE activity)